MPKQPDRYLAIQVLGGLAPEDDREEAIQLLRWIGEQGMPPWTYVYPSKTSQEGNPYPTTDLTIVMRAYDTFPKPSWRDRDSTVGANLQVPWPLPEETRVSFDLNTWNNQTQRTARINIITSFTKAPSIPLEAYDSVASQAKKFTLAMHQKLGAKLTVMDYSDRVLEPYPKTMPLYVGWCTIVGKEVADKYKLAEKLSELPGSIKLEEQESDLVFTSTQPYSEYVLNGWDEEAKAFWKKVGGKLLLPKGKKHSRSSDKKDGKTYIVGADEQGNAALKPFKLPET